MADKAMKLFICDGCNEAFESASLDGEAEAEAQELFGRVPENDDRRVLCDGCYKDFLRWLKELPTAGVT